jgi:hypothetical protein
MADSIDKPVRDKASAAKRVMSIVMATTIRREAMAGIMAGSPGAVARAVREGPG